MDHIHREKDGETKKDGEGESKGERDRIHLMLIRKSANTRPAAKLITSRYRKTSAAGEKPDWHFHCDCAVHNAS